MFDTDRPGSIFAAVSPPADAAASPAEPARVPLERLEAQICELAGHLAAATCRFLVLLADFDARRGWASWEMGSCAQWLSWKCQMSSGTAREHVRVARALRDLPVIRARFAAGRLSYAKVRALTRIATAATEAGLAELAGPMTGNQLERFARAHRRVTRADDADARVRRRLTWRVEEDGSLSGTFRLPPLQGAVLLKALRAACAELVGQAGDLRGDVAETPAAPGMPGANTRAVRTSSDLADGLVAVAESFLAGKVAGADDAEVYQVVVHAGTDVLTEPAAPAGVSAETPAARARDGGRCRFPGCESRRVDLHHIQHWVNGGRTDLENLVSLCPYHHKLVHDRGYLIAAPPGGFAFYRPDGTPLPSSPPLPEPDGGIGAAHDADITPDTIIPPWYGERLDLNHAIWACFANARTRQEPEPDDAPANRGRVTIYEPEDCDERYRQYLEHAPRYTGPTLIPIQV